jgi:hypothetical protein
MGWMMSEVRYKQCRLRRRVGPMVRQETTTWLPERYAIEGTVVALRHGTGWDDGWKVASASGPSLPEKLVVHRSRDYTRQRRASDI